MQQFGLDFVFETSRRDKAHGAHMGARRNFGGAAHGGKLGAVLDQAHDIEFGTYIADRRRRALAAAALGADLVQRGGDATIPAAIVADGEPQRRLVGKQFDQLAVEFADRMCRVEAEGLARSFRAVAKPVPDFPFQILLAAKQDRLRRGIAAAGDDHQYRLGFGEAAEVLEIAVGAIGEVRVAVARLLRRRRNQGDPAAAAAHALDQGKSALAIRREAVAGRGR